MANISATNIILSLNKICYKFDSLCYTLIQNLIILKLNSFFLVIVKLQIKCANLALFL